MYFSIRLPASTGHDFISEVDDFKPSWLPERERAVTAVRYVDGSGRCRVKGGPDLKQSQSYPLGSVPQFPTVEGPHFFSFQLDLPRNCNYIVQPSSGFLLSVSNLKTSKGSGRQLLG